MALKGNQKKLDKNNNNRIDAQDFKILKAEKAKGRGMGLQDEKVKPGKVMKARMGNIIKPKGPGVLRPKPTSGGKPLKPKPIKPKKYSKGSGKKLMTPKERAEYVKKAKGSLDATAESLMDKNQPKKRDRLFSKHGKMGGGMMKKPMGYNRGGMYLSDEKIKKVFPNKDAKRRANISQLVGGDRVSPMKKERFTAGQRARRRDLLKNLGKQAAKATPLGLGIKVGEVTRKIKEKISKKMGGGMMQRPMGYKSGTMVMARGCKLGRKKATKIT